MNCRIIFVILTLIAALLVGCCGCQIINESDKDTSEINNTDSKEKTYEGFKVLLISQPTDSIGDTSVNIEYELQDRDGFEKFKPDTELSISIRDKNLKVTSLQKEEWVSSQFYPVYSYADEGGVIYKLNPFGKVTDVWWSDRSADEAGERISEDKCIQIAREVLSEYIENSENFVLEKVGWASYGPYGYITFREYVNGVKTSGYIKVNILHDGTVASFVSSMIGMIPEGTKNPFDMDKIEKAAHQKLDEILVTVKEYYDEITFKEENYELTILKDGNLAILYRARLGYATHDGINSGEILEFVITQ